MTTLERIARSTAAKRERKASRAAAAHYVSNIFSGCTRSISDAIEERAAAKSDVERQRAHRQRARDIGDIPPPRHARCRAACQNDLLKFGLYYCSTAESGMLPLLARRPSPKMQPFVAALQDKILNGGLKHVRWPRGKGKTTWVKIAMIWAAIYGHKKFMVVIEKTKGQAQIVVDECWRRIMHTPFIAADFPEFSIPMSNVELSPQKMRSQLYRDKPTYMRQEISGFNFYRLPTLEGFPNTGAIMVYRGADQAIRGLNIDSRRPDFVFIDDPQDEEDARNAASVRRIEKNITGAVLGVAGAGETVSAIMASTPIEPNDVSETFASQELHPEWETETCRLVESFGPKELMGEYLKRCAQNQAAAHEWYVANRASIEEGVSMMDDGDFDARKEVSAYEHALNLLFTRKHESFFTEYQMAASKLQSVYKITANTVAGNVNSYPQGEVPKECGQGILAFIDVNSTVGLRWEIAAFGASRRVAVLSYGRYPSTGSLIPEGTQPGAISAFLRPALRTLCEKIAALKFVLPSGETASVDGVCLDGGWRTADVAQVVAELNSSVGKIFAWSKGYAAKEYSRYHAEKAARTKSLRSGEECHTWVTANGEYLAINSDYWKEQSQTSFLSRPLSIASSSLFGDDAFVHLDYAGEVAAEELVSKERSVKYGDVYKWKKNQSANHFGDTHAGVMAFGAIRGNLDRGVDATNEETLKKAAALKKPGKKFRYVR